VDLNHLHLHVRDLEVSRRFYQRHFGFREKFREDGFLMLHNEDGFDLGLMLDPDPASVPDWFHFGFRMATGGLVVETHARLVADDVSIARGVEDTGDFVSFRCVDPDGYAIEIYWE
jgi:catechol 2,3-dioxygenase-like lactoylglutathione lyase family enzyme